jgi:hypothetical protein
MDPCRLEPEQLDRTLPYLQLKVEQGRVCLFDDVPVGNREKIREATSTRLSIRQRSSPYLADSGRCVGNSVVSKR